MAETAEKGTDPQRKILSFPKLNFKTTMLTLFTESRQLEAGEKS